MSATLDCKDAQTVFENLPIPALLLDEQDHVIAFNNAFTAIAGESSTEGLIGANAKIMVDHPLKKLVESVDTIEWQPGSDQPLQIRVQRVPLESSSKAAELRLYIDESDKAALQEANESLNEKLQKNILTDETTGLLNHRGMILALEPQVARSRRYSRPLTVVLVDLESTAPEKRVWTEVSHLLKDQLRWADLVGVTEDNHFLIALPETTEDAAEQLNTKIQQLLEDLSTDEFNGETIRANFGIAGWQKNDNASSMISRAAEQLIAIQQGSSETTAS